MATTPSTPTSARTSHPSPTDTSVEAQKTTPSSVESTNASTGATSLAAATTRAATDNPPLRASKRVVKRKTAPAEIEKAKSGKKKLKRKGSSRPSASSKSSSAGEPTSSKAQRSASNMVQQDGSTNSSSVTRAGPEFNLSDFMSSFQPGLVEGGVRVLDNTVAASPPVPPHENDQDQLAQPRQEIASLRGQVDGVRNSLRVFINPNDQGELPAQSILQLSSSSFADQGKKAKGDYQPPQAHALAAGRLLKGFAPSEDVAGNFNGAFRKIGVERFDYPPLPRRKRGRLLEAGSSNCNFACDFSPSATLPKAQPFCRSYNDILDGIHGLSRMGEELWHLHMLDLTDRLRIFVSKNKSADSASLPARVKLVLQYVNKWLGAALGHLQDDDPAWWTKFSRALTCIEFNSPEWTMALVNTLSLASSDHQRSQLKEPRDYNSDRYEEKAPLRKEKGVPEDISAMIPVNGHGEEPCLRYLGGVMCSGGTRDRCGHPKRTHDWPSKDIPRRLREWAEDNYSRRRGWDLEHKQGRRGGRR